MSKEDSSTTTSPRGITFRMRIVTYVLDHRVFYDNVCLLERLELSTNTDLNSGAVKKTVLKSTRDMAGKKVVEISINLDGTKRFIRSRMDPRVREVFEADWALLWQPDIDKYDVSKYEIQADKDLIQLIKWVQKHLYCGRDEESEEEPEEEPTPEEKPIKKEGSLMKCIFSSMSELDKPDAAKTEKSSPAPQEPQAVDVTTKKSASESSVESPEDSPETKDESPASEASPVPAEKHKTKEGSSIVKCIFSSEMSEANKADSEKADENNSLPQETKQSASAQSRSSKTSTANESVKEPSISPEKSKVASDNKASKTQKARHSSLFRCVFSSDRTSASVESDKMATWKHVKDHMKLPQKLARIK